MSFKTELSRVAGLGSAKDGTHHFWQQRVTAVALVLLTPFVVFCFAGAVGSSHAEVREIYASPFTAIVTALFIAAMFIHLKQGLQVVIEDYIHHKALRIALLVLNAIFCACFGFAGVFAIAKLAFS